MADTPTTSTTLLRDLAKDSQHARWGEFVARYRPMMEAYMRERFPSLDADDVIQETLVAVCRVMPSYHYDPDAKGHFHNYLTGILRHRALRMMDEEKCRSGLTLEPPDVAQWKYIERLRGEKERKSAEWVHVPPKTEGVADGREGWMKAGDGQPSRFFASFGVYNKMDAGSAYVHYVAKSWFANETNTVLYCNAKALLRSEAKEDVAQGVKMMKGFLASDDPELKTQAMICCIEAGISTLDDFGGTNAAERVRFAAIKGGDARMRERLAVGDPDPDVRKAAYESIANPSPMVSARYIAQIRAEDDPGDITKPLKVVWGMTNRDALDFLIRHSQLEVFRDAAQNRLNSLGGK